MRLRCTNQSLLSRRGGVKQLPALQGLLQGFPIFIYATHMQMQIVFSYVRAHLRHQMILFALTGALYAVMCYYRSSSIQCQSVTTVALKLLYPHQFNLRQLTRCTQQTNERTQQLIYQSIPMSQDVLVYFRGDRVFTLNELKEMAWRN